MTPPDLSNVAEYFSILNNKVLIFPGKIENPSSVTFSGPFSTELSWLYSTLQVSDFPALGPSLSLHCNRHMAPTFSPGSLGMVMEFISNPFLRETPRVAARDLKIRG